MRYYTFLINNKETPCVSNNKGKDIYSLWDLGVKASDIQDLIINYDNYKAEIENLDFGKAKPINQEKEKILAPIVHPLRDALCLGANYLAHAEECEKFSEEAFGGRKEYTIYFSKRINKAAATGDTIPLYPDLVDSLDYETELCVVLGKEIKAIKPNEVRDAIFGYTIINDVSARNLQTRHKQWFLGKSLDGYFPMGPSIVTKDEIDDIYNLKIKTLVNGEVRQDSSTALMVQNIEAAICELSAGMTIQAASLIAMGTPSGVGMGMNPPTFLKEGDKVHCEIEEIGYIENVVSK